MNNSKNNFEFNNETNVEIKAMGKIAEGYTVIPNNIMNDMRNIGSDSFTVFAKILQYVNSNKNKISVAGLSTLTGLTKNRVSKALNKLIDLGYIRRYTKFNGNIKNGYIYEIYGERQITETNEREHVGNARRTENKYTDTQYTENTYYNNKKEKIKGFKKEKDVVVVVGEKSKETSKDEKIIELYKQYKIQLRVMPQMKKLLLKYSSKIELELYEEIFMLASEDNVKSKYNFIKTLLESFDKKGISNLEDYKMDCNNFKSNKQVNTNKTNYKSSKGQKNSSNNNKIHTRYHDVCSSLDNMTQNEVEESIAISQYIKFNNEVHIRKIYTRAMENGISSISENNRKSIINYAIEKDLVIPR